MIDKLYSQKLVSDQVITVDRGEEEKKNDPLSDDYDILKRMGGERNVLSVGNAICP
jgi:hypothetical protein